MWDPSSPTRDQTHVPWIAKQILNQWTTREDPALCFWLLCKNYLIVTLRRLVFPGHSIGKESACSAGDLSLIPSLVKSPGEGNGKLHQYPCLENPMDRGAWWDAVGQDWVTNIFTFTKYVGYVYTINSKRLLLHGVADGQAGGLWRQMIWFWIQFHLLLAVGLLAICLTSLWLFFFSFKWKIVIGIITSLKYEY